MAMQGREGSTVYSLILLHYNPWSIWTGISICVLKWLDGNITVEVGREGEARGRGIGGCIGGIL
jgi:hypothetical protein